jgi:putative transcriptional regulator
MTMSKKADTLTDFDTQLIAGMEEVVAYINGAPNNGRATVVEFADAKAIREGLGMSQAVFCRAYGIPLKTLQHWEQRRHNPDRTASAYLWTIEEFPDQVREAQQRHQMRQPGEIEQRPGL